MIFYIFPPNIIEFGESLENRVHPPYEDENTKIEHLIINVLLYHQLKTRPNVVYKNLLYNRTYFIILVAKYFS